MSGDGRLDEAEIRDIIMGWGVLKTDNPSYVSDLVLQFGRGAAHG